MESDVCASGRVVWGRYGGVLTYFGALLGLRPERRTYSGYGALVVNGLFYYGFCYGWFNDQHHGYMGLLALAVAACYLAGALYLKKQAGAPPEMLLVAAGVALSFVTLAIPIQLSGYSITLAWAVESAALAYLAARFQSVWPFGASGWWVFWRSLRCLASTRSGLGVKRIAGGERAVYSVCGGGGLPGAECILDTIAPGRFGGDSATVGHFILLVGLHLEVFAWIGAGRRPEDDLTSQQAVASTILLALYGFALVAHGIAKNFRLHRLLGLLVFAVVIAKLYLFDIWQLNWLYKVLAFGGLGALLLSGSYLYSRYRNHLLALLKEEPAKE